MGHQTGQKTVEITQVNMRGMDLFVQTMCVSSKLREQAGAFPFSRIERGRRDKLSASRLEQGNSEVLVHGAPTHVSGYPFGVVLNGNQRDNHNYLEIPILRPHIVASQISGPP